MMVFRAPAVPVGATLCVLWWLAAPPARAAGELPISVVLADERVPVYSLPDKRSHRRGTAVGGYRLPVYRMSSGNGCRSEWLEVYTEGWVCGDLARAGDLPPDAPVLPELPGDDLLPYPCAFVREGGTPAYQRLADALIDYSERWLEQGYSVSVRRRVSYEGERYYQGASGLFVRMSETYLARPSRFHGTTLSGAEAIGWTFRHTTRRYRELPGERGGGFDSLEPQTLLRFTAEHAVGRQLYLQTDDGGFVRAADVRRPTYEGAPFAVGPFERWFDIDRDQQVIVAYEGSTPIYATLVSSGRRGHSTPTGEYRIWTKLITDRMANETPEDENENPYYLEDVPWVMYFNEDIAVHGAYWHKGFGQVRSHGCVNVAPIDARALFGLARPELPRGWWSVLPTEADPGSRVVVR